MLNVKYDANRDDMPHKARGGVLMFILTLVSGNACGITQEGVEGLTMLSLCYNSYKGAPLHISSRPLSADNHNLTMDDVLFYVPLSWIWATCIRSIYFRIGL